MGLLIYSMSTSLDGFVADGHGIFEWTAPSEDELIFINDIERRIGTYLLRRRMCETLAVWDTMQLDGESKAMKDFANIWQAADKVMYSKNLTQAFTKNTRVEHTFDAQNIRKLKQSSDKDLNIGGPHLAVEAIRAGLVDEYHQFIVPIIVGAGNSWLPKDVLLKLELADMRSFKNGFVHLAYKPAKLV